MRTSSSFAALPHQAALPHLAAVPYLAALRDCRQGLRGRSEGGSPRGAKLGKAAK